MSDFTTTTNFALKKPTVGQAVDTWGTYINANFDAIDQELQTLTVSITTPDLEGLGNVLALTPSTDQFLRFNGESWAATTVTIATQIDDLTDVDLSTSPTTNQVLTWSGSSWIAATPSAATIADNSITTSKLATDLQTIIGRILVTDDDDSPTNGQILQYSTADTEWKYADLPGSTVVTLGDVNSASLADNALLVYNSSAGEFQFASGEALRTTLGVDVAGTDNSTDISISSSTSYDYITLSAGQVLTINQVNLGTDVTGTLPVAQGGTGGTTASAARTALGLGTISTQDSDDVTITGGNISGIVDLAIADGGTGASSVGAARTNLGLGSLATQDTITESQISDLQSYLTAETNDLSAAVTWANVPDANITQSSVTQHQAALSITESQISDLQSYLTAETNDLGSAVTGTLGTGNGGTGLTAIGTANQVLAVNAGATALEFQTISITESQISDLQSYLTAETNDLSAAVTWANVPDANITQSSVTQHQAALSITESQISDLGSYQTTDAGLTSIAGLTTAADKMIYTTAADTYAVTTLTSAGRALLDDADAAAQRTTLGLGSAATSNTSAFEAAGSVSTHAALTEVHGISAFGATLVDDADAPAARTTLGLGSLATQSTITESQISDLQSYLTAEVNDLSAAVTGTLGTANGGTGLTSIGTAGQVLTVNAGATALEYQTPLVALPITDSADNNVLSESGGVVTLTADEANVGSNALVVNSSGNVGVGTSPSTKLDISDTSRLTVNVSNAYVLETSLNSAASAFASHYENALDHFFQTSGTERMRIDSSGNLLVGSSSKYAAGLPGNVVQINATGDGGLVLGNGTSNIAMYRDLVNNVTHWYNGTNQASLTAAGAWTNASDARLKTNVREIKYGLETVLQTQPRTFERIDVDGTYIGFVAQELQTVIPEVVSGDPEKQLGIDYGSLVAVAFKAIQEQQALIESQQSQIDALTARIEALETT